MNVPSGNTATPPLAHSANRLGDRQLLVAHIEAVTALAARFAGKFDARDLASWAGRWHDIGKFHPEFQRYLADAEANPDRSRRGPDHKAAGANLALRHCQPLAHLVVGHHGGLRDQADLKTWLCERADTERVGEAIETARDWLAPLEPEQGQPPLPPTQLATPLEIEFLLRMLFSALVDADFLDTEAHFEPDVGAERAGYPAIAELRAMLERSQAELSGRRDDPVNAVRDEVYRDCLRAAAEPPGFFRLTVPTGGGKTRSGLAFALRHAATHGLERVIVAVPYTTITDQTAATYRDIFGSSRAVLEHHSAVERDDPDDARFDRQWERLAAQNWDAPLVVTTTVQLFESLFGRTTSACRKLHNLARSVVILDEAQALPEKLLTPILDVLRELVAHYNATVVLCTATQPAFDTRAGFGGLPGIREIVVQPARHFERLRRVEYDVPAIRDDPWTWERVAEELRAEPRTLTIVNTKADALALLDALDDPGALHLSTLLCGAHRRDVLRDIHERLAAGEPCHVVSTQVVEAGVDLDFPVVMRAVGPLDRIVQAAGRCNREGRLTQGRVVIFRPAEGSQPPGAYITGADLTEIMLARPGFDFHDPAVYSEYFAALYERVDLDARKVQPARAALAYATVADKFRMIDDDTTSVLVRYRDELPDGEPLDQVIWRLRERRGSPRALWRALQPFIVGVRRHVLADYARTRLADEVVEGLWEWKGDYHPIRGLVGDWHDADKLVI